MMLNEDRSIVLISNVPQVSSEIGATLRAMPKVRFEERNATLSEMNGSAVKLAAQNDIVIFKTDISAENDIIAVKALREQAGKSSIIFALSEETVSLADARKLTQAGVNEVLPLPLAPHELRQQIEHWTRVNVVPNLPAHYSGVVHQGKIITIAQSRGGIGATTLAINLADQLMAKTGMFKRLPQFKVALVDLDLQFGTIASSLDIEPSDALYKMAIEGEMPDKVFIEQSLVQHISGLSVLAAPAKYAPIEALRGEQIGRLLDLLRADHELVVVNLPRALVEWMEAVLERTDRLILLTDSSVPSIRQARRLIDVFTAEHLALQIEVVVGHEKKPMIKARHHIEASKVLERPFRHWLPFDPRAARDASDRGVLLSIAAKRSPILKAIKSLAKATLSALAAPAAQSSVVKKQG
jgi:pilus assembly protein CpaE